MTFVDLSIDVTKNWPKKLSVLNRKRETRVILSKFDNDADFKPFLVSVCVSIAVVGTRNWWSRVNVFQIACLYFEIQQKKTNKNGNDLLHQSIWQWKNIWFLWSYFFISFSFFLLKKVILLRERSVDAFMHTTGSSEAELV